MPWSSGTPGVWTRLSPSHDLKDDDVARLSPPKDRNINFLGH
ncbi:hypothetical protein ACFYRC_34540 [Streptomyces sp. NPDC005279]